MDIKLDPWQQEIIDYNGHILLGKGRRIGATHVFARKAVEHLMKNYNPHPSSQIVCSSITADQSQLIISFATDYATKHYKQYIGKGKNKPTLNRLILVVGGNRRILLAKPVGTTGDASRGFEGQVLMVDEAPYQPDSLFVSAKPILMTTGGKIWMWGTFKGRKGYFWDKYEDAIIKQNPKARFKVFEMDSETCMKNREISATWTETQREEALKFLEEEKNDMSAQAYAQEYLGIASVNLSQFFSDEWIEKVCTRQKDARIPLDGHNVMGNDLARMGGDSFTAEVLRKTKDRVIQIDHYQKSMLLTTDNEDLVLEFTKKWDCFKSGIDAGSGTLGVSVLDHLLKLPYMKRRIVAMNNRKIVTDRDNSKQRIFKQDLYDNLRAMGERGEIELFDDLDVKASLRSIQIDLMEDIKGNTIVKIHGRFSHIAEGLIRAAWLAKKEKFKDFHIHYV